VWGPVIFATLVPIGVLLLGGMVRTAFRQGRIEERVKAVERDVTDIHEDLQWWIRHRTGQRAPSENRRED
jgi:hypothetical protein